VLLVLGLLLGFGALVMRMTALCFGEPKGPVGPVRASYLPIIAHLALVLAAGLFMPRAVYAWFQGIAGLLG
jgi:hydrogenase-4 component F